MNMDHLIYHYYHLYYQVVDVCSSFAMVAPGDVRAVLYTAMTYDESSVESVILSTALDY
jgi:hypothetical protein